MKYLTMILMLICMTFSLAGQTAFGIAATNPVDKGVKAMDVKAAQVSAGNAWFGSTLSYTFDDDVNFDDSFLLNARLVYEIPTNGKIKLPILGNVAIPITNIDLNNIEVGLYPWTPVSSNETFTLVVHGGLRYKVFPSTETETSLQTTSILGGLEGAFFLKDKDLPLTVSLSPVYDLNNLIDNDFRVEVTGIFPLTTGLGLLAEWDIQKDSVFRLGVITNTVSN